MVGVITEIELHISTLSIIESLIAVQTDVFLVGTSKSDRSNSIFL